MINPREVFDILFEMAKRQDKVFDTRVIAVVIYNRKTWVFGKNRCKTHPLMDVEFAPEPRPYLHAEADALIRARKILGRKRFERSSIYVLRTKMDNDGTFLWGNAEPCFNCKENIRRAGIKNCFFTMDDGNIGALWMEG